jgi:hypothetical protein
MFDEPLFGDGDDSGGPPNLIIVKGGLPDTLHARLGQGRRLDAWAGESVDGFCDAAAFVIVSGGPLLGTPPDTIISHRSPITSAGPYVPVS